MDVSGMKKEERLLAIANYTIEHPKLNIQVEPLFNSITMRAGHVYYGEIHVQNYSKYSQLIYIEVLKGFVELQLDDQSESNYIMYQIDGSKLVPDYEYEEEMYVYYPGGVIVIEFRIKAKSTDISSDIEPIIEVGQIKTRDSQKPIQINRDVDIFFEKNTYSLDDAIELKLYNASDEFKNIVIESEHDLIHPQNTEFFLKDIWTQEWYIQQTTWDKIIGRVIFKEMPFEEIVFSIQIGAGESRLQYKSVKTTVTAYPSYLTSFKITDYEAYQKLRIECLNKYVFFLIDSMNRKALVSLVNMMKACLNFSQLDFEIRLLYLWVLVEIGDVRVYEQEAKFIRKYNNYYQKKTLYPIFVMFEKIIKQRIGKRNLSPSEVTNSNHWLILLIQARYVGKGFDRYLYYRYIYESKIRHGFLFAEAVRFLNKYDVLLEANDQFYPVCIQWALNKSSLSKHWAHRIVSRQKLWIRRNPYMSSRLLMQLYKVYPSNELLHLCCEKSIAEGRKDRLALEYYKIGLSEGSYIKNLDQIYVETVTKLKEQIDFGLLRYMNFVKDLSIESKGYVYKKMIEADIVDYSRFSRMYQELIRYIKEMSHDQIYMNAVIHILLLIKEQIIRDHFYVLEDIIKAPFLEYIKNTKEGIYFLTFLIEYSLDRMAEPEVESLFLRIETCLKPEGLILLSHQAKRWYEQKPLRTNVFLNNSVYKTIEVHDKKLHLFLSKLLNEASRKALFNIYEQLSFDEQNQVRHLLCHIICRRILIDEMAPSKEDIRIIQSCYDHEENHNAGLLLTLLKILPNHKYIQEINYRDIIVPWSYKNSGKTLETSIQYYGELNDELRIYYRYEEDEDYHMDVMEHLAFGMFVFPIYLFYGEFMEYYIVKTMSNGEKMIVVSDIIYKQTASAHIDFITFAMEVGDSQGVNALIDEYVKHLDDTRCLLRI